MGLRSARTKMGLPQVTTTLRSITDPQKSYEALFLVDTGATDWMAPADELAKLGIPQQGKTAYELADGTVREYPFGLAQIEFMGDPASKTLKRLPAIPLK